MTVTSKKKVITSDPAVEGAVSRGAISYHCDFCQVDIEDQRIQCAVCEEFDLCVYCFSHGAEIGSHRNFHGYRIIKKHTFPLFEPDWGADEELLLLEALEMYGMGSWAAAAEYIGSKTKEECEAHYIRTYLTSGCSPLPDTTKRFDPNIDTTRDRQFHKPAGKVLGVALKLVPVPRNKVWASQPLNHEVQGYMPGRLEFETEFDNEGESAVKDLSFREDDAIEEIEFKLALLDAYNNKLNKREYRKRFLTERGITDYKKNHTVDKKRSREEKLLFTSYKVFARLHTAEDHADMIKGLITEQELKAKIARLQEYRTHGILTFAEAEGYDKAKELRDANGRMQLMRDKSGLGERSLLPLPQRFQEEAAISWNPTPPSDAPKKGFLTQRLLLSWFIAALAGSEGCELLADTEVDLCSSLRLLPKTYLAIKRVLLREYTLNGTLQRRQAQTLIAIDPGKISRIYDFFVKEGWIQSPNSA
ncbi:Transcriptional adapter ada2 [Massospora cicadina]|nr:Transcriptional adapter ada2 [Massospora cicadina]